jgi:heptosyltransferase-2
MNLPFVAGVLGWLARRYARGRLSTTLTDFQPDQARRVLLVLTTGIGDAIFSTAAFPSIRAACKDADIRLFCRPGWQQLFEHSPYLDGLIAYPGKFRKLGKTIVALRDFAPDLVIILHGNDPDILPLAALSGARHIVRIPVSGTRYPDLLSNRQREADQQTLPGLHYIDNRVRILDTLGIPVLGRMPVITLAPALLAAVQAELSVRLQGCPYWVLHIHAANPYKSVPAAVATALLQQGLETFPGHEILLSGSKEDLPALQQLAQTIQSGRVHLIAGQYSLEKTAACLSGATAVVAPDTGILHLAAALNRPVLGLFAPTDPMLVGPRTADAPVLTLKKPLTCTPCQQKKCPYAVSTCMSQFTAQEILEQLGKLITSP